ncbi:MAG: hypothetical protein KIS63_07075 [Caldilineales bacterium]|nr:hypothetical protein [Caldilineales bacterium]
MKSLHATVVSHTHWDRAWYVTFQEYRIRLVRLVDRLLDLLATRPDYRFYMLDGQMAVLEDYLEVRPQRAGELQALSKAGRISVGPWYVLADEFLVSPEALIRNLLLGHRMGLDYGGVMKIGYVPDGFGHVGQLPQILRGFGIDNAFFWRGLGAEGERLGTEFEWRAPDSSTVTTIWMPYGYHNISNIGYPIHWGDISQMEFDADLALAQIRKALAALQPLSNTPARLLMNGIDHAEAEPAIPQIIARANAEIEDTAFYHGTLGEHLERVRASGVELPVFEGEFRWGRYSEILQGVYATRIHLKQINHRLETLFERYMEPLAALAWLSGADVPEGTDDVMWTAWRWLLKNHPHDDIYGSGIDAVHEEMLYRFGQAEQIGQFVVRDSLRQLARQVDFTAQSGTPLLVYNPLGWDRQETVVGDIDFDFDDPTAENFQLVDSQGQVVPHQVLSDEQVFWMETLKPNRKRRLRAAFPGDIPACGYRAYWAQPGMPRSNDRFAALTAGFSRFPAADGEWQVREDGAENRHLAFTITADGGLDVTAKARGPADRGLGHFQDVDDAGDEYSYCPATHSQTLTTSGQPAAVSLVASGPCLATFRIERVLRIPAGLTPDRRRRARKLVALPIVSEVTLYRDRPGLYISTHIDNQAHDHKLSVVFPTGLNPARCTVDAAFAVMPRDIDLPDAAGWVEDPTSLMHQRAFTDVSDPSTPNHRLGRSGQGRGLAVLNRGLPAVEVTREQEGTQIALTLLRSVGWLSRDDLFTRRIAAGPLVPTPGAQCLGPYTYEYAILPHSGDWHEVYQPAYNYVAPLLLARADTHEGLELREMNITRDDPAQVKPIPWPRRGPLPNTLSFLRLDPPTLALSAVRRTSAGGGLVVRVYNLERQSVEMRLTASFPLRAAYRLNLAEERQEALTVEDGGVVVLPSRGAEIVTCELCPAMG